MRWFVIRHADKAAAGRPNPELPLPDEPLSSRGRAQAQALLGHLQDCEVDGIVISQYLRTAQTIDLLARSRGIVPTVDARLNEFNNGRIAGLSDQEIQQAHPEVWSAYQDRDRDFRFPGGETGEEVRHRIDSFMREYQQLDQDLILVSHDGWIRIMMCHVLGLPVHRRWDLRVDLAGISEIDYQPQYGRWRLVRFNQGCG